jgi:hypothetical protein
LRAGFVVHEFTVTLLHLLDAMHDQLQKRDGVMLVSMLCRTDLRSSLFEPAIGNAKQAQRGDPLLMETGAKHSRIELRWCRDWRHVCTADIPLGGVYLPSCFCLSSKGLHVDHDALQRFSKLLASSGAPRLWPPLSWDEMLERKDLIYSRLNKYMLPAQWVSLASVDNSIKRLEASILQWCKRRGDGFFWLKGRESCAKVCCCRITLKDGCFVEDVAALLEGFVTIHQQIGVGVQKYCADLPLFELRTWLVADPFSRSWRSAVTIKTSWSNDGELHAELFQPLHGKGLLIAGLIDTMLSEKAEFFTQLLQSGIPALRVDCGYDSDPKEPRAFLNEFAATTAWMWSELTGQDLPFVVGRAMGESLFSLMTRS